MRRERKATEHVRYEHDGEPRRRIRTSMCTWQDDVIHARDEAAGEEPLLVPRHELRAPPIALGTSDDGRNRAASTSAGGGACRSSRRRCGRRLSGGTGSRARGTLEDPFFTILSAVARRRLSYLSTRSGSGNGE